METATQDPVSDQTKADLQFQQDKLDYQAKVGSNPAPPPVPQFKQDSPLAPRDFFKNIDQQFSNPNQYQDPNYGARPYSISSGVDNKEFNRYAQSSDYNKLGYLPFENNENRYHDNQSTLSRLGNTGVNLINKTVSYTLQNFGLVLGAPVAALTGDISKMTDNFLVRASDIIKDYTQDHFPIYKGDQYTKGSIWDKLASSDWWMDDANDRVALTLGMFAPAIAAALLGPEEAGAAALGATGGRGVLTALLQKLAGSPQVYGKLAKGVLPEMFEASTGAGLGISEALAKYAPSLNYGELTAWNVIGQSGLNASETQAGIKKSLEEKRASGDPQFKDLSDQDIKQKAAEGAKNSFWETVPLALSGSFLEVPAMFNTAKAGRSMLDKLFNSQTTEQLANALKSTDPGWAKVIGRDILTGIEHGQNEAAQVAISNYNEKRATGENTKGTLPGLYGEFMDHRDDPNFQNNEALGTIQGLLMGMGGHVIALSPKILGKQSTYEKQDEYKKNFLDIQNLDRLRRSVWNLDITQKDEQGNTIIQDGKPLADPQKIVTGALGLLGLQDAMTRKQAAIKEGKIDNADLEDHQRLAGFAQTFFGDPSGMKHLTGWLAKERDENLKNPEYELLNGISAEQQYQKNINQIKELKDLHDNTIQNQHSIKDLDIKPEDKDKLKYVRDFLNTNSFSQYQRASDLLFYNQKLSGIHSDLSRIQAKLKLIPDIDDKGEPILKPFSKPSSPDELEYNKLIERKTPLENNLIQTKSDYRTLLSKSKLREAFDTHVSRQKPIEEVAKTQTEAQKVPITTPTPEVAQEPTQAATPTKIVSNEQLDPVLKQQLQEALVKADQERTANQEHPFVTLENFMKKSPVARDLISDFDKTQPAPVTQPTISGSNQSIETKADPAWQTQDLGDWEGTKEKDHEAQIENLVKNERDTPSGDIQKGESTHEFFQRVLQAIIKTFAYEPDKSAVVTSSSVIKAILALQKGDFKGIDTADYQHYLDFHTKNGEVYPVTFQGKTIYFVRHGETEDNKNDLLRTPETPLTDKGKKDIEKAYQWFRANNIRPSKIITSPFLRTRQTTQGLLDKFSSEDNPILPEFLGKIVFMSEGSGKTWLSEKYPQVIDGDKLMVQFMDSKNIPHPKSSLEDAQKSGIDFHNHLTKNPKEKDNLIAELQNYALDSVRDGTHTLLTASKYLRAQASKVYLHPTPERIAKAFTERGQAPSTARTAAVSRLKEASDLFEGRAKLIPEDQFAEHILTGTKPETKPIEIPESLQDKFDRISDLETLDQLRKDLQQDILGDKLSSDVVEKLYQDRRKQLVQDVSFQTIHDNDLVIMKDTPENKERFGPALYAQVVVKNNDGIIVRKWYDGVKGSQGGMRISADAIKNHISLIYRPGMTDEDVSPIIDQMTEQIAKQNQIGIMDTELVKDPVAETKDKSADDIMNELLNNKDC